MSTLESTEAKKLSTDDFGDPQGFYLFRILQSLRQSIRAVDQYSKELAAKYHVTAPQLICLNEIQQQEPVTLTTLARQVHLSPSTVTGIIERLEKKKLIERIKDDKDKRKLLISLTDEGHQLIDDAPKPLQDRLAESFSSLPEEEQLSIVTSLEKVVDMVQARNIDASPLLETGPIMCPPELKNQFWEQVEENHPPSVTVHTENPDEDLTLRPATDTDTEDIIRFINSSVEWYKSIIDENDLDQHEVSEEWVKENLKEREFFVASVDGVPVGTLSLQFFGDYAYLGYVYIDVNYVGKGYGSKLLCYAKEESLRRGMKGMVLIAHPQATWAIKAYQKFGFELKYRERETILNWNNGCLKPYFEEYFMLFMYDLENE